MAFIRIASWLSGKAFFSWARPLYAEEARRNAENFVKNRPRDKGKFQESPSSLPVSPLEDSMVDHTPINDIHRHKTKSTTKAAKAVGVGRSIVEKAIAVKEADPEVGGSATISEVVR
jgi:hypothetical protein